MTLISLDTFALVKLTLLQLSPLPHQLNPLDAFEPVFELSCIYGPQLSTTSVGLSVYLTHTAVVLYEQKKKNGFNRSKVICVFVHHFDDLDARI